jgi:Mn2+/Fe2+ NRAMP family transporter
LVAILGATVSPYVSFWQASQELEERKSLDLVMRVEEGVSHKPMRDRKLDVAVGTMFSNLVMYFIMLTTALTLHRTGITSIETSRDAAEALKPLAGPFATALFTLGIVGAGLIAIPTLIGSAAYAIAETFRWTQGLNEKFSAARPFYGVIILSIVIGVALDFANVPPLKALFWAAIVNGVLAPFLLIGILVVVSDRKIMRQQPTSLLTRLTVAVTALAMLGAAIGMFIF